MNTQQPTRVPARGESRHALAPSTVHLTAGTFDRRRRLNREYLVSLSERNLVQNHLIEAGIGDQAWHLHPSGSSIADRGLDRHWGWETPGSLLRGHFLGHWMSAAARETATTGDVVLRAKLDGVLELLARCQEENGGEWVFATPVSFLRRLAEGRDVWAPQYAIHKTFMGLVDVYRDLGDERALQIAHRAACAIAEWARGFERERFQQILEMETGGMLEVWADLLEATGDDLYRELLDRYWHASLFDALLAGEDALTNMHANTTIPEVLGAARAFEVTGEERWKRVVEQYWDWAVTRRGTFCTGGQTSGEIWTPPFSFAARRGAKTQEHCSVYNMIRLADVLYRWGGDPVHLDYIETNLHNGLLAQQHPETGMVAYFLPLEGGARKHWGTPTEDFWCCHGSLVQAHTRVAPLAIYADDDALTVAQYLPVRAETIAAGQPVAVEVRLRDDASYVGPDANGGPGGELHRPKALRVRVSVTSVEDASARVRLRIPEWTSGEPLVTTTVSWRRDGRFLEIVHDGGESTVELEFPFALRAVPIPDEPDTVAFVEGPIVLAGLIDREVSLEGDPTDPSTLLVADDERQWAQWLVRYRSRGRDAGIRFIPLNEVTDQRYSVYFPIRPAG
ncbi:glycoside hydrolase family 127 protein [Microbacterium sp. M28]|uniref:glycoside hydrolase family 127 protein n=1 Tax=Microbacterium sp. M28 TaxID=2962064 RepID=UPI0021F41291|nr:glycoside hydrolase family 127 protein [Microbacterium sp. M28]UYO97027.1 glycoside hydrolase family 127 protein [Microbacterium sp. M28]